MRQLSFKITLFFAFVIAIFSCTDPAAIGSELLLEDQANLKFTDEVKIRAKTVNGKVIQTYSPFSQSQLQLDNQLLGQYNDPIFGQSEASIYTQISLGSQEPPTLETPRFDSIILSIAYDTLNNGYGDLNQVHEYEVFLLEEDIIDFENYFSDQTFQTSAEPIGSASFVPNPSQTIFLNNYTNDSITVDTVLPHIRIPLSASFGNMLLQDTSLYQSDSIFQAFFKGMYIRAKDSNSGLLNLDFTVDISRVSLFYTNQKGEQNLNEYRFDFNPGNARIVNLSNNYEGTEVEEAINTESDDLIYLQGMVGVNSEITFPDLTELSDIVVNKAELELTVASASLADSLYDTSDQLFVTALGSNDEVGIITDVRSSYLASNPVIRADRFGGIPVIEEVDGVKLLKYRINISGHFQQIIEGNVGNTIILTTGTELSNFYFLTLPKAADPTRTVFYGPNHPQYPAKLNLTYTAL